MVHKKKYLGGLLVFFCLLLVFLLGNCSSCFASTPTVQQLTQFIDVVKDKQSKNELNNNSYTLINGNSSLIAQDFYNKTQDINYTIDNLIYVSCVYIRFLPAGSGTRDCDGVLFIANNTFSNTLDYLGLSKADSTSYSADMFEDRYTNLGIATPFLITGSQVTKITNNYQISVYQMSNVNFNFDVNTLNLSNNMIFTTYKTASIYWKYNNEMYPALNNYNGQTYYDYYPNELPTEPEEPSGEITGTTGTITNNSGDKTGNIDLSGIETGLTNIQNQISGDSNRIIDTISGETQKMINTLTQVPDLSGEIISSEQITENIDFGLITNNSTLNGYTNFWLTLTNGLRGSLTGNVRSIDIDFRSETYTISLDDFSIQLPQQLKFILGMLSTIYFVILIVKWWKIIIDKITSGNIDEVLSMNEEERNC